ncbi:MAG: type II secretion system protein, partial [Rickettsiales bacterium]
NKLYRKEKGFTLVELSIVIVVIGLLVAGIMSGTEMVKSSRLIAVTQEMARYSTAFTMFKSNYGWLPGDMPNASAYWPGATNGFGSGQIVAEADISLPTAYITWQQLSLSKLISANYTGPTSLSYNSGSNTPIPGVNIPDSIYGPTVAYWADNNNWWGNYSSDTTGLILSGHGWYGWIDYEINVVDAYSIDSKIDDGLPLTGKLIGFNSGFSQGSPPPLCASVDLAILAGQPIPSTQQYVVANGATANCTLDYALMGTTFAGSGK